MVNKRWVLNPTGISKGRMNANENWLSRGTEGEARIHHFLLPFGQGRPPLGITGWHFQIRLVNAKLETRDALGQGMSSAWGS